MPSVMLHNLRIDIDDPCLPRWRLHVNNISLIRQQVEERKDIIYVMLTVLRLRTGYGTINPTKAGRDWSAGIRKRYKSGYRSPDKRSLDAKSVL